MRLSTKTFWRILLYGNETCLYALSDYDFAFKTPSEMLLRYSLSQTGLINSDGYRDYFTDTMQALYFLRSFFF